MTVEDFARRVTRFRDQTGASVISWGRTTKVNQSYRVHDGSLHLADLAVDVIYDQPMTLYTVRKLADELGLALRRETHHDHIEPLPGGD